MSKTDLAYADLSPTQEASKAKMTADISETMGRHGEAIYDRFSALLSDKDISLKEFKNKFVFLLPEVNALTPHEAKAVLGLMRYKLRELKGIRVEGEAKDRESAPEGIKPWLPELIDIVEDAVQELGKVTSNRE